MSFFSKVKKKLEGVDPQYEEVKLEQIDIYQKYFIKVISSIDIDTQTKWSQSKEYSKSQMNRDDAYSGDHEHHFWRS